MSTDNSSKSNIIIRSDLIKTDSQTLSVGNNKLISTEPEKVKQEKEALGPLKILSCIIPTDIIFRFCINPLEIARVRISRDLMSCSPTNCASPSGMPDACNRCLPTRSVPKVIYHIGKHEGANVLLNGFGASIKTGLVRSGIFYPLYEYGNF